MVRESNRLRPEQHVTLNGQLSLTRAIPHLFAPLLSSVALGRHPNGHPEGTHFFFFWQGSL